MSEQRFVDAYEPALTRLGQDLKEVLRLVEDPDMDEASRVNTAGRAPPVREFGERDSRGSRGAQVLG